MQARHECYVNEPDLNDIWWLINKQSKHDQIHATVIATIITILFKIII